MVKTYLDNYKFYGRVIRGNTSKGYNVKFDLFQTGFKCDSFFKKRDMMILFLVKKKQITTGEGRMGGYSKVINQNEMMNDCEGNTIKRSLLADTEYLRSEDDHLKFIYFYRKLTLMVHPCIRLCLRNSCQ